MVKIFKYIVIVFVCSTLWGKKPPPNNTEITQLLNKKGFKKTFYTKAKIAYNQVNENIETFKKLQNTIKKFKGLDPKDLIKLKSTLLQTKEAFENMTESVEELKIDTLSAKIADINYEKSVQKEGSTTESYIKSANEVNKALYKNTKKALDAANFAPKSFKDTQAFLEEVSTKAKDAKGQKELVQLVGILNKTLAIEYNNLNKLLIQKTKIESHYTQAEALKENTEKEKRKSLIGEIKAPGKGTEKSMLEIEEELL